MGSRKNNKRQGGKSNDTTTKEKKGNGTTTQASGNAGKDGRGTEKSNCNTTSSGSGTGGQESGEEVKTRGKNDPAFYARDEQLLKDAASLPFNYPTGATLDTVLVDSTHQIGDGRTITLKSSSVRAPGVFTLVTVPNVGLARDQTSAVNIAANAVYSRIREKISGTRQYDPCDYIIYLLALAEMTSYIQWAKRLYALTKLYSDRNFYFSKAIVQANGFDIDDLVANQANMRKYINRFIDTISIWALPKDIYYTYFRHSRYEALYFEGPSIKEQVYQFVPGGFLVFSYNSDGAGCLDLDFDTFRDSNNQPLSNLKFTDLQRIGNRLLANVNGNEDFGTMSGDTRRTFEDALWTYDHLDEEYSLLVSQDPYVLLQIKNSDMAPTEWIFTRDGHSGGEGVNAAWIDQSSNGSLISHARAPHVNDTNLSFTSRVMLDKYLSSKGVTLLTVPGDSGDVPMVADATRLKIAAQWQISLNGSLYEQLNTGADFVCEWRIAGISPFYTSSGSMWDYGLSSWRKTEPLIISYGSNVPELILMFQSFKWAPIVWLCYKPQNNQEEYALCPCWDMDNTTVIHLNDLCSLSDVCNMSLFNVPGTQNLS